MRAYTRNTINYTGVLFMRNTNQNPAVDHQAFPRLIATVIAVLSVVAFILPYDYLQYFTATDTYAVGSNSLYGILVSLGNAESSLFSYIPAFMPTSILGVSATISLYGFAAALLLAFLLAVCAIFSGRYNVVYCYNNCCCGNDYFL